MTWVEAIESVLVRGALKFRGKTLPVSRYQLIDNHKLVFTLRVQGREVPLVALKPHLKGLPVPELDGFEMQDPITA